MSRALGVGLVLFAAGVAQAAPVTTRVELAITVADMATATVTYTGVSVDVTGSTVTVPALSATGLGIVIPVTATTAVESISANTLGIDGGIFSAGGVTNQLPAEICPALGIFGKTCNVGGGIGGSMGLAGTVDITVIPTVVVVPLILSHALIGQGGFTIASFTSDAAAFTTGQALLSPGPSSVAITGASAPLTLVTPTFLDGPVLGELPVFVRLTLTNVSISVAEPGSLWLVLAGVAGLTALGRR